MPILDVSGYGMMAQEMKARVFVSFKPTVLDPQGQTIRSALATHGHSSVRNVRAGKFFDIELGDASDAAKTKAEIEQIAADVLANPVIEDYKVEILG